MSKAAATTIADGVTVKGAIKPGYERVLTPEALAFVAEIERKFGARRRELVALARARRSQTTGGLLPAPADARRPAREPAA